MTLRGSGIALALALTAAVAPLTAPEHAAACGGLFCNAAQQVNQAAERIIFAHNADDTITAVIEIQYDGPAERFSWLLPVPGVPELAVSSKSALDRLQTFTNPSYRLQTSFAPGCGSADAGMAMPGFGTDEDAGSDDDPVIVLAQGTVGPFDFVVIQVDSDLEDRAQVATDWLEAEEFDVPARTTELLGPYLDENLNLLAIRLTKGNSTGAIRPIRITYEGSRPFIPIRPTAVAANDDMGVLVFVVGESRAIPENYKALELNEALIDWNNPMRNYNDVVSAAADESGGQGFVTEYAQSTETLDQLVVTDAEHAEFERLSEGGYADAIELVIEAARLFAAWDGFEEALDEALTQPASLGIAEYLECPHCYADDPSITLDEPRFLELLAMRVFAPMADTQALLASRPYVTRLYTTMSADEMTVDPLFNFNDDLPDVSNVHMAERVIACDGSFRVTLPQGGTVYGRERNTWPIAIGGDYPAARVIREPGTSGDGRIVVDHSADILALLDRALPPERDGGVGDGGRPIAGRGGAGDDGGADASENGSESDDGCSCAVPGAPAKRTGAAPWLALAGAIALWLRRRR